jgi:hypothetical protein
VSLQDASYANAGVWRELSRCRPQFKIVHTFDDFACARGSCDHDASVSKARDALIFRRLERSRGSLVETTGWTDK